MSINKTTQSPNRSSKIGISIASKIKTYISEFSLPLTKHSLPAPLEYMQFQIMIESDTSDEIWKSFHSPYQFATSKQAFVYRNKKKYKFLIHR